MNINHRLYSTCMKKVEEKFKCRLACGFGRKKRGGITTAYTPLPPSHLRNASFAHTSNHEVKTRERGMRQKGMCRLRFPPLTFHRFRNHLHVLKTKSHLHNMFVPLPQHVIVKIVEGNIFTYIANGKSE